MAKVIIQKLTWTTNENIARPKTVSEKRVRDSNGEIRTIRTIHAGSRTFGSDFAYVFGKNVAKARRETRKSSALRMLPLPKPDRPVLIVMSPTAPAKTATCRNL